MKQRPHFYYAISENTETGKRIVGFMKECEEASERARQWALEHGAESYYESPNGMAGGICAVEFANTIAKEGWERVEVNGGVYWLPEGGSETETEMYALPVVSETQLIGILDLKQIVSTTAGQPLPYTFGSETPVIFKRGEYWYADVPYQSTSADCAEVKENDFWKERTLAESESE